MSTEQLTVILAQRVMGWRVGPDRFLMDKRQWLPRWRFQPLDRLQDAMRLLEVAAPKQCMITADGDGLVSVRVHIAGKTGESRERSKPRAIVLAVARALQIDVDSLEDPDSGREPAAGPNTKRPAERR